MEAIWTSIATNNSSRWSNNNINRWWCNISNCSGKRSNENEKLRSYGKRRNGNKRPWDNAKNSERDFWSSWNLFSVWPIPTIYTSWPSRACSRAPSSRTTWSTCYTGNDQSTSSSSSIRRVCSSWSSYSTRRCTKALRAPVVSATSVSNSYFTGSIIWGIGRRQCHSRQRRTKRRVSRRKRMPMKLWTEREKRSKSPPMKRWFWTKTRHHRVRQQRLQLQQHRLLKRQRLWILKSKTLRILCNSSRRHRLVCWAMSVKTTVATKRQRTHHLHFQQRNKDQLKLYILMVWKVVAIVVKSNNRHFCQKFPRRHLTTVTINTSQVITRTVSTHPHLIAKSR